MVRNMVVLLIALPLLAMFFMPKKELYYLLEKRLSEQNIVISGETLQEDLFGFTVKHPTLYLGGAPVAAAKEVSLWSLWIYTKVNLFDLQIAKGLPSELSAEKVSAVHSIGSPFEVRLVGESSLGALRGKIQLKARMIHLDIAKGGENKALARYLKKSEKGWVYESRF